MKPGWIFLGIAITALVTMPMHSLGAKQISHTSGRAPAAANDSSENDDESEEEVSSDGEQVVDPIVETAEAPAVKSKGKAESKSEVSSKKTAKNETSISESSEMQGAEKVKVTNLEYKANKNGGTVVIQTSGPANFLTRKSEDKNQVILELANAELPAKFKRPYITKEFSGLIGSFSAYQKTGSSVVRVVVQLKEAGELFVQQEGKSIMLIPPGGKDASQPVAQTSNDGDSNSEGDLEANPAPFGSEETTGTEVVADSGKNSGASGRSGSGSSYDKALNGTVGDFMMGNMRFYGKPISIEFRDGDIRDVLNFIADESGLNMIISEDVKGAISIKLRQVPWDQALVLILQAKRLGYVRQGRVLRIAPLENLQKEAESTRTTLEAQKNLAPLRTKVFRLSHAKAKDAEGTVKGFLSTRAKTVFDDRTNSLIVTDLEENISKVSELIRRLDRPTPQVLIEGKVVEAGTELSRTLGIQWSNTKDGIAIGTVNSTDYAKGGAFTIKYPDLPDLTTKLGLLEKENKVKTLASPRVTTLSGETATIKQTFEYPVYTYTTVASTTPTTTATIVTQSVKLIDLTITPFVSNDGRIRLEVDINREFNGPQIDTSGARLKYTRSAKSKIIVRNGQTAVIAGTYNNEETNGEEGIPLIRKIPILGNFFKYQTKSDSRSEMSIFLTPTIIE